MTGRQKDAMEETEIHTGKRIKGRLKQNLVDFHALRERTPALQRYLEHN